jgi:hypothetical protein
MIISKFDTRSISPMTDSMIKGKEKLAMEEAGGYPTPDTVLGD